jgi:hypothetical protein
MNPLFPGTAFIPDGEPRVFIHGGEERLFIYGSRDETSLSFCGTGHDAWSAPANDLTRWTNHGEIINVRQVQDIGFGRVKGQHFGAPDCVYNPVSKKYYFYTFFGANYKMDGLEGPLSSAANYVPGFENLGPKVSRSVSDSPAGPFEDPVMCDWPPANGRGAFDPAVLVDEQEDGPVKVYAYWGMTAGADRWAELDPHDMHTIIDGMTGKPDRNAWHKILKDPAGNHGSTLFEASSIRKVAMGKYVYIYSATERPSALTFCYANSPEGPWTYGGRIVDNSLGWHPGNCHGSIANVKGEWYVVYHRATWNDYNRQAMAERITLTIDGDKVTIPLAEMTSEGTEADGLPAFRRYNAGVACYHTNHVRIAGQERNPDGLNPLVGISGPATLVGYKYFNFGNVPVTDADNLKLKLNMERVGDVSISMAVARPESGSNSPAICQITKFNLQDFIPADGAYHDITIPISGLDHHAGLRALGGLKQKLAVYFTFVGEDGDLCRLKEIEFARGDTPTPNPLREVRIDPAHLKNGALTALPTKGRPDDSIKLSVIPDSEHRLKTLAVTDDSGRAIELNENGAAPYAPRSFNFPMPASAVTVSAEFES